MVRTAKDHLRNLSKIYGFTVSDIQAMPFADATFDVVVANHMLYHVQDREKALSEVHRVLKVDGHFYAATNGPNHMREVFSLLQEFDRRCEMEILRIFNLANGAEQLSGFFSQVNLHHYEDALLVTAAEPLAAYAVSMQRSKVLEERGDEFIQFLQTKLAAEGVIRIQKETGLFEARKGNGV